MNRQPHLGKNIIAELIQARMLAYPLKMGFEMQSFLRRFEGERLDPYGDRGAEAVTGRWCDLMAT